jgi:NitT/TauT family transport system substrate-binding protein
MILSNDFLPSFGNVVVTSDSLLKAKPATARAFLDAIDESFNWVISGNVEEALKISMTKYTPTWQGQEGILTRAFNETFIASVWQSAKTKTDGLGAADVAAWQGAIDAMAEAKLIDKGFKAEDLVVQPKSIKA